MSRLDELLGAGVPTLVVQGGRDAFGSAALLRAAVGDAGVTVVEVADADHSFRTRRADATTTAQALAAVAAAVTPWLADRVAASGERSERSKKGAEVGNR